ncbi:aldose 1-epimerase, putative [Babesia ovata]|uniref:Aldose 1-epimerase, putative n=1 Tax=Babesia ovata TaxID=189622 RepID=A0A2H6KH72_9APIC|nr:aldose 1-epimerase, putative [Babesia ovata]GBE62343.1 aldose 1-epimerase, putative [Babesia ovata]
MYDKLSQSEDIRKRGWRILKTIVTVLSHPEMGLHLQMVITVATFLLVAHTHVYMRQVLPLVPYAITFALLVEPLRDGRPIDWKSMRTFSARFKLVLLLILGNTVLCFVGGALFANFIGFT